MIETQFFWSSDHEGMFFLNTNRSHGHGSNLKKTICISNRETRQAEALCIFLRHSRLRRFLVCKSNVYPAGMAMWTIHEKVTMKKGRGHVTFAIGCDTGELYLILSLPQISRILIFTFRCCGKSILIGMPLHTEICLLEYLKNTCPVIRDLDTTSKTPFGQWTRGSEEMCSNWIQFYTCARADVLHPSIH